MFTHQLVLSEACERHRKPEDSPETDLPRHRSRGIPVGKDENHVERRNCSYSYIRISMNASSPAKDGSSQKSLHVLGCAPKQISAPCSRPLPGTYRRSESARFAIEVIHD